MKETSARNKIDRVLLVVTILLSIVGILFVFSASRVVGEFRYEDEYYYLKRQLLFFGIGLLGLVLFSRLRLSFLEKITPYFFFFSLIFLILVIIPGIGSVKGGARSWIQIGSFSIQPSEFIKFSCLLVLARGISYRQEKHKSYLFLSLFLVALIFGLIMLQPDFGTGLVFVLSCIALLFFTGVPLIYFIGMACLGGIGLVYLIASAPYRMERILSFLNPFEDPLGSGFQAIQSLFALVPSGLFGLGYGNSIQKHFFLPEPQNDFIFAIYVEEMGLVGAIFLLALFVIFIVRIFYIAKRCENIYYRYLVTGIGCVFFVQIFLNLGVVTGLLPVTGVTLPFFSYGGSSLVVSLMMVGVVLAVSRYRR
jgi:cell division protein FtsW